MVEARNVSLFGVDHTGFLEGYIHEDIGLSQVLPFNALDKYRCDLTTCLRLTSWPKTSICLSSLMHQFLEFAVFVIRTVMAVDCR
jgi:hypothetical protein